METSMSWFNRSPAGSAAKNKRQTGYNLEELKAEIGRAHV
jgi:hypothetical protein